MAIPAYFEISVGRRVARHIHPSCAENPNDALARAVKACEKDHPGKVISARDASGAIVYKGKVL